MGAEYCTKILDKMTKDEVKDEFYRIQEQCRYMDGHGGYSGTFAEKHGVRFEYGVFTYDKADAHCLDHNDKWEAAGAYKLDDGRWFIGGWCSS